MPVTLTLIVVTSLVSVLCFFIPGAADKMMFNAYAVHHGKQGYRMFSYGLVHSSFGHLFFNMLTLFFFGEVVEEAFAARFDGGALLYVLLYVSALAVSSIGDLVKHRDDAGYNAVGASGAVSAVLFASILFNPTMGIYIYLIPIPIPAFIFAPLYLLYCWYMARRATDNIGHTAHFWGAVYGLLFPLILHPSLLDEFFSLL